MVQAYRRQFGARFIAGIPGDAFGPGDDFHPEHSHVIAALIRRMHEAKAAGLPEVEIWGTGSPRRGFIFADDLANACLFVLREYDGDAPINISGSWDISIRQAAETVKDVVGYGGSLRFNPGKPDGMPVKVLDTSALRAMGWSQATDFRAAAAATYAWFLQSIGRTDVADTAVSGQLRTY
jgi:GDP-L-fucose synthase